MCGWSVRITRCWWSDSLYSKSLPLPTTKFLFWNINRKPVADVVAELAEKHQADIVILAESAIARRSLLATLNATAGRGFHLTTGISKGITILTRFSREFSPASI